MKHEFTVTTTWDSEASVWVAESEDVPGLVTEAETLEVLIARLRTLIPELLEANGSLFAEAHADRGRYLMPAMAPGAPQDAREAVRLEYRPHIESHGAHTDRFSVHLDGELILRATRSPLYAGARELLKRGHDPEQLMTIRLAGRDYESFEPSPIGHLAQFSVSELKSGGLRRTAWQPIHIDSPGDDKDDPEAGGF